jgi:hypothetical protein
MDFIVLIDERARGLLVIATASAVRTFLIPETLDSTPFFP